MSFPCEKCDHIFDQKSDLKRHTERKTPCNPKDRQKLKHLMVGKRQCKGCKNYYSSSASFCNHVKRCYDLSLLLDEAKDKIKKENPHILNQDNKNINIILDNLQLDITQPIIIQR